MSRLFVLVLVLLQFVTTNSVIAAVQRTSEVETAARVAVELSALEAAGDFNMLYDRIHPDARAEVPRAAAVGWFQDDYAPRGPGVATVTGVRFVSWTWAVTGVTYPSTAEVSFVQPFASGPVEDVVRLVQDHNGEWRWFFGRSREFVNEQIAKYVPALPVATQNQSIIEAVASDIDTYWSMAFATGGTAYSSPVIVDLDDISYSACGTLDPRLSPGYYCSLDTTIYISISTLAQYETHFGDFAWITILAHEWGHHVQFLSGAYAGQGNAHELQADCLAGSYALDADTRGILDDGDVLEGLAVSASAGDPVWMAQDQPGTHGTGEDRVSAFMRGFLDGFLGCQFAPASTSLTPQSRTIEPTSQPRPALIDVLPSTAQVPADLSHTGDNQRSLSDVIINYTNPVEAERLFREWGWNGNATRIYDGIGTYSGVTSVYVSIHRLSTSRNAALALDYSIQDQAISTGAWEVSVSPLGSTTRALSTVSDITIYVQQGNILIRLTVAPAASQSTAEDIMRSMLATVP